MQLLFIFFLSFPFTLCFSSNSILYVYQSYMNTFVRDPTMYKCVLKLLTLSNIGDS